MSDTKPESDNAKRAREFREKEEMYPQMSLIEKWKYCRGRTSSSLHECHVEFAGYFIRIIIFLLLIFLFYQHFLNKKVRVS